MIFTFFFLLKTLTTNEAETSIGKFILPTYIFIHIEEGIHVMAKHLINIITLSCCLSLVDNKHDYKFDHFVSGVLFFFFFAGGVLFFVYTTVILRFQT